MKGRLISISVGLALLSAPAIGYEWATHALMANEAYKKTAFGASDSPADPQHLARQLGFTSGKNAILSDRYFDLNAGIASVRFSTTFEKDIFDKLDKAQAVPSFVKRQFYLDGWLARGVIREDDVVFDQYNLGDNTPQDEPGGNFQRVFGHFYDPRNDRPLTLAFRTLGVRAPDWAVDPFEYIVVAPNNFDYRV